MDLIYLLIGVLFFLIVFGLPKKAKTDNSLSEKEKIPDFVKTRVKRLNNKAWFRLVKVIYFIFLLVLTIALYFVLRDYLYFIIDDSYNINEVVLTRILTLVIPLILGIILILDEIIKVIFYYIVFGNFIIQRVFNKKRLFMILLILLSSFFLWYLCSIYGKKKIWIPSCTNAKGNPEICNNRPTMNPIINLEEIRSISDQ